MKEKQKLSPFRDGKQAGWCGAICKINNFVKYLKDDMPIVGGNWNPNDYVDKRRLKTFIDWLRDNYIECLDPDDSENILYASMGTMYEDKQSQEHSVDIFEVVDNWIEDFVGECVDGTRVKASPFGRIGIGSKFWANYFYKKGGILLKGEGDKPGDRRVKFALFFPESVWRAMDISPQDLTEYEEYEIDLDD